MGAGWGAAESPHSQDPPAAPATASSVLSMGWDAVQTHGATQLSPAASIESIGMWILKAVPAEGNISLDPFLFSIGRTG